MLVAYFAHPLGDSIEERADNHQNAINWVKFLINSTQWSINAPWLLLGNALTGSIHEPRRVHDSLNILERCDVLILCGGYVSLHMHEEIKRAHRCGIPILDLTMMGVTPPEPGEDIALQISNRVKKLLTTKPRRVWLPLLTLHDLEAMKDARHTLYTQTPDEHTIAVRIMDRIIAAAFETGAF